MSPPTGPPAREESQPSESEQIAALEARYPAGLMGRVREACELHRKRGRMADGVWLRSLRAADKHPLPRVVTASRTFLDKHPDGTRDERYWLGIVRNTGPDELRQRHIRGMAPVGTDWTRAREEMLALGIAEAAE